MTASWTTVGVLAIAAMLGSIPFGLIVGRLLAGKDVRREGSGNIGATNVLRAVGIFGGVTTLVCDAGKGALAVVLARAASPQAPAEGWWGGLPDWAAVAAVAGHMFSPWLGFRGGKGVATGIGAALALSPAAGLIGLAVFGIVVMVGRFVSLASIAASGAVAAIFGFGLLAPPPAPAAAIALGAAIIGRHHANIRRLLMGTEPRLRFKRPG